MRVQKPSAGFTLIEVMIVVAIVGVLASIAIPNYKGFICKTKQTEAKALLKGIYMAEWAYYNETNMFLCDAAELRLVGGIEYTTTQYNIVNVSCFGINNTQWTADVRSQIPGPGGLQDVWQNHTRGGLIHFQDGCN
ncbi:MAG: prepilin-type N-terminal cleavage/methylation domain-containing protein [Pseudomonadota bacterium]